MQIKFTYIGYFSAFLLFLASHLSFSQKKIFQSGHIGSIETMELSPDQLNVATGGEDGRVLIWDINLRVIAYRFETYGNPITDIAYHPSKPLVAAIDGGGNIFIWDLQSHSLEKSFVVSSFGIVERSDVPTQYQQLDITPRSGMTNGGQLAFTEKSLLIGLSSPQYDMESSLFEIMLVGKVVKAFDGIPKRDTSGWFEIKELTLLKENLMLVHFENFNEGIILLFDRKKNETLREIVKLTNINSVALNHERNKVAISSDPIVGNERTIIYNLDLEKIDFELAASGNLVWEGNSLWIGSSKTVRSFNTKSGLFENQFITESPDPGLMYLPKHRMFLQLDHSAGIELFRPLIFERHADTRYWVDKDRFNFNKYNLNFVEFLSEERLLIQHSNLIDFIDQQYIWNFESNSIERILKYQERPKLLAVDQQRKWILGQDIDSTQTQLKKSQGGVKSEFRDPSTLDIIEWDSNQWSVKHTIEEGSSVVGFQESDGIFLLQNHRGKNSLNAYIIDYVHQDTLLILKNQPVIWRAFYDPITGNIGVYSKSDDKEKYGEGKISFYNPDFGFDEPFYIIPKIEELVVYDGRKKLLIKEDFDKAWVVDLAIPNRPVKVGVDINLITIEASFHPEQPWIFLSSDEYDSHGVLCYDYVSHSVIGGYTIEVEGKNGSHLSIDDIAVNREGNRLAVKLENNQLFVLQVSGTSQRFPIATNSHLITNFQQKGDYLHLEHSYYGSNLINLKNLSLEKNLLLTDGETRFGLRAISWKESQVQTFAIENHVKDSPKDDQLYLHKSVIGLQSDTFTDDSLNLSEIGITQYDHPFKIIENRYLFLTKRIVTWWDKVLHFEGIKILDLKNRELLINERDIIYFDLMDDRQKHIYLYSKEYLYEWEIGDKKLKELSVPPSVSWAFAIGDAQLGGAVLPSQNSFIRSEANHLLTFRLSDGEKTDSVNLPKEFSRIMLLERLADDTLWTTVYSVSDSAFGIVKYFPATSTWAGDIQLLPTRPIAMKVSEDRKYLMLSLVSGEFEIRDARSGKLLIQLFVQDNGRLFALNEQGFYHSSDPENIPYRLNFQGKLYYSQDSDLLFNRPDILLKLVGKADQSTVELYHKAVQNRWSLLGVEEKMLNKRFVPLTLKPVSSIFNVEDKKVNIHGSVSTKDPENISISLKVNGQQFHKKKVRFDSGFGLSVP